MVDAALVGLIVLGFGGRRCGVFGEGGSNLVEVVLGAVDTDHGGIALAVVVIDVDGGDVLFGLREEVDGFLTCLRSEDGLVESICGEDDAVNSDQLLAGG